jgi:peptide chain release factor 3
VIEALDNPRLATLFPDEVGSAPPRRRSDPQRSHPFDMESFLAGRQTPVFFGSAINNFGVQEVLQALIDWAPPPSRGTAARASSTRPSRPSPGSCSRSRRTWIRTTATASRSFACARAATGRR